MSAHKAFAVSVTQGATQATIRVEPHSEAVGRKDVVDYLTQRIVSHAPLVSLSEDNDERAIIVVPGPGMMFMVLGPWEDHLVAGKILAMDGEALRRADREEIDRADKLHKSHGPERPQVIAALQQRALQLSQRRLPQGQLQPIRMPGGRG